MSGCVRIGDRLVGDGAPCLVIAEVGNNHNGSLPAALELIEACARGGADAVKFQLFAGADIVSSDVPSSDYPGWGVEERHPRWIDFLDELALSAADMAVACSRVVELGMLPIVTPAAPRWVDTLEDLDVPAYKIASMDVTNLPLLERVNLTGKPVLLSTGMAGDAEVESALRALFACPVVLLHCVSKYPVEPGEADLGRIRRLARRFDVPTGYSDHSLGAALSVRARELGAVCIEKHVTLDRSSPVPAEHHFSLEPDEFAELAAAVRAAVPGTQPAPEDDVPELAVDRANAGTYRRGWRFARDLSTGSVLSERDLAFVRPAHSDLDPVIGAPVGAVLAHAVHAGQPVHTADLATPRPSIETLDEARARALGAGLAHLDASAVSELGGAYDSGSWDEGNFIASRDGKWDLSVVALDGATPCGFIVASLDDPQTAHLHRVLVAPRFRGTGLGMRLMTALLRRAHSTGALTVNAEVPDASPDTQRFYRRCGFVRAQDEAVAAYLAARGREGTRAEGGTIVEPDGHRSALFVRVFTAAEEAPCS